MSNIEGSLKSAKKTNDSAKLKKSKVKAKTSVANTGAKVVHAASPPVQAVDNIILASRLREEAIIQEEVQSGLRHLAKNVKQRMNKSKSQRGGAVDVSVDHKVRWPHYFVLADKNKDRATYNNFSPVQWMVGFCWTIREESDVKVREQMLYYVIDLLDDATDFPWASPKASHAMLLCRMEQGVIKSWLETDKIDRVRRAHPQRHNSYQSSTERTQDKNTSAKTTPCVYYN